MWGRRRKTSPRAANCLRQTRPLRVLAIGYRLVTVAAPPGLPGHGDGSKLGVDPELLKDRLDLRANGRDRHVATRSNDLRPMARHELYQDASLPPRENGEWV